MVPWLLRLLFRWLNTCIGSKNYRYFVITVAAVTLKLTLCLILTIAYLIEAFVNTGSFTDRMSSSSNVILIDWVGVIVVLCVLIAILFPLVALVYQLAGFHCMLG